MQSRQIISESESESETSDVVKSSGGGGRFSRTLGEVKARAADANTPDSVPQASRRKKRNPVAAIISSDEDEYEHGASPAPQTPKGQFDDGGMSPIVRRRLVPAKARPHLVLSDSEEEEAEKMETVTTTSNQ